MQKLVLMQGPPGSGKSSRAAYLAAQSFRAVVVCTDDQFLAEDGDYKFELAMLGEAHQRTREKAEYLLRIGLTVIVANTTLRNWEAKQYVLMADRLGVPVEFVRCDGRFGNTHGVPAERVEAMRAAMEDLSVEAARASLAPWEQPEPAAS